MKKNLLTFSLVTTILLLACSQAADKNPAKEKATVPADTVEAAKAPEAKQPENVMEVNFSVKDYAAWRKGFDADSTARMASGLNLIVVGRNQQNPNNLIVALSVADVEKAKTFMADPKLKTKMNENGVISKPDIHFWHVLRMNTESNEKQWVLVTHKVKDFAAWQKVFDSEGTASRATNGLIDVALAGSIDDPNLVHIVFDIKDMAKAKARINDPALKKLMTDGGVEGAPKIDFYNTAE